MNINTPLAREFYEITLLHENHGASDLQTQISMRLSKLGDKIEKLENQNARLVKAADTAMKGQSAFGYYFSAPEVIELRAAIDSFKE